MSTTGYEPIDPLLATKVYHQDSSKGQERTTFYARRNLFKSNSIGRQGSSACCYSIRGSSQHQVQKSLPHLVRLGAARHLEAKSILQAGSSPWASSPIACWSASCSSRSKVEAKVANLESDVPPREGKGGPLTLQHARAVITIPEQGLAVQVVGKEACL